MQLPPVDLDPSVRTIDTKIDQAQAKQIARDFALDLGLLADAIKRRDPLIVQEGAAGPMFNDVSLQAQMAQAGKTVAVPTYELDRIAVLVVRSKYQAGPQLGIDARGTVRRTKFRDGEPTGATGPARPFHRRFSLLATASGFKIYADVTDG